MSVAISAVQPSARWRGPWRVFPALWAGASVIFCAVDLRIASNQFSSPDLVTLSNAGEAARHGAWLSSLLVEAFDWLPGGWTQALIALTSALAAGLFLALLFVNLCGNDWRRWHAAALSSLVGVNAVILFAVTSANNAIPLIFACALLVPIIRRLESIGDVQAEMAFGLVLPLLLLAGPPTAPLVVFLAAASAFSDPDARRDWRAFAAMFLVALMPSLIALAGLLAVSFQHGRALSDFLAPYVTAPAHEDSHGRFGALSALMLFSPLAILPILYCVTPDRRMKPMSAIAVVALPLYLALGRALFGWAVDTWAPAALLIVGFAAWLSVARLRRLMHWGALALMAFAALVSWTLSDSLTNPGWLTALAGSGASTPPASP